MSFRCAICNKGITAGKSVSHSHKASNRFFRPNLQHIRINIAGRRKRLYVCTACLRSGKVAKLTGLKKEK